MELLLPCKPLINYLHELSKENTQLEDLIDVIDDASMETDVLIQEMMEASNALKLFMEEGGVEIGFV
jgi:hypothetical protein